MNPINSTDPLEAKLEAYHKLYCQRTGREELFALCVRDWWEWSKYFTADDLDMVLEYIQRENQRRQKAYVIRIAICKIIGDPQRFNELRADAIQERNKLEARKRQWQPTERDRIVAEWWHEAPQPVDVPAKPSREVLHNLFTQMRDSLQ